VTGIVGDELTIDGITGTFYTLYTRGFPYGPTNATKYRTALGALEDSPMPGYALYTLEEYNQEEIALEAQRVVLADAVTAAQALMDEALFTWNLMDAAWRNPNPGVPVILALRQSLTRERNRTRTAHARAVDSAEAARVSWEGKSVPVPAKEWSQLNWNNCQAEEYAQHILPFPVGFRATINSTGPHEHDTRVFLGPDPMPSFWGGGQFGPDPNPDLGVVFGPDPPPGPPLQGEGEGEG